MSTSSKKSTQGRPSSARKKARLAVQRVPISDRRHLPKPRVGFEKLVGQLATLVAKFGDELGHGLDVELMRSSLSAYQALEEPYQEAVDTLGGLAFVLAGQVPEVGAVLHHPSGWCIEVTEGNDTHVTRLRLHRPEVVVAEEE